MTRSKARPPIRKPVFDEESVLSFAALNGGPAGDAAEQAAVVPAAAGSVKEAKGDRRQLSLLLKREVITRLEEEAARKEKTVGQVVEKLVTKHLGKH
jgi:hypothetical protein